MNGSHENHITENLESSIRICQLNIEIISREICQHLQNILGNEDVDFLESDEAEIADYFLHSFDTVRKAEWIKIVESLNFQRSSRQASSLLGKLRSSNTPIHEIAPFTPDVNATQIVTISKDPKNSEHTKKIKREFQALKLTVSSEI